jgi:hypothetical protein
MTGSLKLVSSTPTFGANDRPACPICNQPMHIVRRRPHSELGIIYERQRLECDDLHVMQRDVDSNGAAAPPA